MLVLLVLSSAPVSVAKFQELGKELLAFVKRSAEGQENPYVNVLVLAAGRLVERLGKEGERKPRLSIAALLRLGSALQVLGCSAKPFFSAYVVTYDGSLAGPTV